MLESPSDYGNLAIVVRDAGCIIAAGSAVALTWKGRARWEPSEEDVPRGAQKVAGLLTGIAVVLMWFWLRTPASAGVLTRIAIGAGIACFLFLLLYAFLISVFTFKVRRVSAPNVVSDENIIGGFWLNEHSRRAMRQQNVTEQELLAGAAYDADKLWPRPSRALAKLSFIVSYVGLTCLGTAALASASVLYSLS